MLGGEMLMLLHSSFCFSLPVSSVGENRRFLSPHDCSQTSHLTALSGHVVGHMMLLMKYK